MYTTCAHNHTHTPQKPLIIRIKSIYVMFFHAYRRDKDRKIEQGREREGK